MILDTSAIVAILFREPGCDVLLDKLAGAPSPAVGVPTLTEAAIVVSARIKRDARTLIARFLMEGSIATVPFGEDHYGAAIEAWLRYGKGRSIIFQSDEAPKARFIPAWGSAPGCSFTRIIKG